MKHIKLFENVIQDMKNYSKAVDVENKRKRDFKSWKDSGGVAPKIQMGDSVYIKINDSNRDGEWRCIASGEAGKVKLTKVDMTKNELLDVEIILTDEELEYANNPSTYIPHLWIIEPKL